MIIKNGIVVTEEITAKLDLRIENEIITDIKDFISPKDNEKVIDATGKYVLPGGIDAHTHFDMPCGDMKTSDDFYSGTKAAVVGGTTTIVDFAEPDGHKDLQNGLDIWNEKATNKSFCDYGFHMTVNHWDEAMESQMTDMVEKGITSFKLYTAYDGMKVSDKVLYKAIKVSKKLRAIVCVHCENGDLLEELIDEKVKLSPKNISNHPKTRPPIVEKEAVSRVVDIATLADYKVYIVHLSCSDSLEAVKNSRKKGSNVIVETCPHYLLLDDTKYNLDGFESAKYVMSPPLRNKKDTQILWQGLANGDIQTVSTDHCSFNIKGQKDIGKNNFSKILNGIPSVEHRMSLLYTYGVTKGKITLEQFVKLTATNPSKVYGMYPKKGTIKIGSDADLIILEDVCTAGGEPFPIKASAQTQQVDYTPYEGVLINDKISHVFLRGKLIVKNGNLTNEKPIGNFLKRKCDENGVSL